MDFKVGDIVRLKSGGEVMTIEGINGDSIECVWHEKVRGKTETSRSTFAAITLEPASKPGIATVRVVRG